MATLTVQSVSGTGLNPTYASAASGGDEFKNTGHTFIVVKNASVSSINVTVTAQQDCDQGYSHDLTIAVPASGERWIGDLDTGRFNNGSGNVEVEYSAVTTVTVAAIEA